MLRFYAGVLAVLLGSISGRTFSKRYKRRYEFLLSLESFAVFLKREIMFSAIPLNKIVLSFNCENEDLSRLLNFINDEKVCLPEYLGLNERKLIEQFFQKIGRSNKTNEAELITAFIKEIGEFRAEEAKKCKKYTSLSVKIGFLAGVGCFVLII